MPTLPYSWKPKGDLWVPQHMAEYTYPETPSAPSDDYCPVPFPTELSAKLAVPLPREAVKPHPTKAFLSTIKVIYVVERFNQVFGINGWKITNEVVESSTKMVVVKSIFTVPQYGIYVEQFGGNDNSDRGDAYKGACTDALSKIGSYLGVGMDVYKGLADAPSPPPSAKGDRFYRESGRHSEDLPPYTQPVGEPKPAAPPAEKKPAAQAPANLSNQDRLVSIKKMFGELPDGDTKFIAVLGNNGYDSISAVKDEHFETIRKDLLVVFDDLRRRQKGKAA